MKKSSLILWFFFCVVMLSCGSMLAVELVEEGWLERHDTLWVTLWVTTVIGLVGLGITFLFALFRKNNFPGQHTGVR